MLQRSCALLLAGLCVHVAAFRTSRVSSTRSRRMVLNSKRSAWSPNSWRGYRCEQLPEYPDPAAETAVEERLRKCAPSSSVAL